MNFEERVLAHRIEISQSMLSKTKQSIEDYEDRLERVRPKGTYYLMMQRRILASSEAMDAWQTFMISVQLTLTDKVTGITH